MCREDISLAQTNVFETTGTKRKQSVVAPAAKSQKRQLDKAVKGHECSNRLLTVLREYGLLVIVVTHLCADDLLALALTSKAIHQAIIPRQVSLQNLLGRLRCSGKGIAIRNECHEKSSFYYDYNCTEYVQCGSLNNKRKVETRACATCRVATCNECRIHAVYQTIYEAPNNPHDITELPNFSGFVMLQPHEHSILSPHHLLYDLEEAACAPWQDPSTGLAGPYHDQGYLDIALTCDVSAPPECIKDLLDLDLGQHSLGSLHRDSQYERPSPLLSWFSEVTESRKILVCDNCLDGNVPQSLVATESCCKPIAALLQQSRAPGSSPIIDCRCTLRNRFIDRWLCLRCYQKEEKTIRLLRTHSYSDKIGLCHCRAEAHNIMCLWCWGKIIKQVEDSDDNETAYD